LIKTVNGGADWQFINTLANGKGTLAGLNISSISFDPKKKEHIFAGSYNVGLYESQDSGNTWTQILSRIAVYDFAIDPGDSNRIYVGGFFADHGKVLVTTDGGKSWEEIFNDASTQNAVRALALNPNNPKEMVIGMTAGTLIKSMDGGVSWKLQNEYKDRINKILWQSSGVYILFRSKGVFKSTDNAQSFVDISTGLKTDQNFYQSNLNSSDNVFYQMAISTLNPNLMYVTSGNGLYKSVDGGGTWRRMPVPLVDSAVAIRSVTIAPSNDSIAYISAGATIYKTMDGGEQWKTQSVPTAGFINALAVDPGSPQIAYGGIFAGQ
jgi:photosystem II stability/assembly factor-like uncharacterized protein